MPDARSSENIRERLVHYAEQLGSLAGTVKGTADGMLDRASVAEHLKTIRDGAADLLKELSRQAPAPKGSRTAGSTSPARDPHVAAPGKRHRAPARPARGIKHSDQRIPKLKTARMKGRPAARRG